MVEYADIISNEMMQFMVCIVRNGDGLVEPMSR